MSIYTANHLGVEEKWQGVRVAIEVYIHVECLLRWSNGTTVGCAAVQKTTTLFSRQHETRRMYWYLHATAVGG